MSGKIRKLSAVCLAAVIGVLLLLTARSASPRASNSQVLAAEGTLRWVKGNMHTHTLWSDGDDYPEMVALWYKEHGYDFLLFSDHNTLLNREVWTDTVKNKGGQAALEKLRARFPEGWIEERVGEKGNLEVRLKTMEEIARKIASPGQFLLIQGEEVSDQYKGLPIHMNATNLKEVIPPMKGDSVHEVMQRTTDALIAQRERTRQPMMIHLNHPNFEYGVTAEDLVRVVGENFFEVYNGHPTVHNDGDPDRASTERIWDIILTRRITEFQLPLMYGLATDDGHNYHKIPSRAAEPGRGWVYVLARDLTPAAIVSAMEEGAFYASTGVKLERVATSSQGIELQVAPEEGVGYMIDFIGTRRGFDNSSTPVVDKDGKPRVATRRYSNEIGRVLATTYGAKAEYKFRDDDLYVRVRITSNKKHPNPGTPGEYERAWCQPALGPAGQQISASSP